MVNRVATLGPEGLTADIDRSIDYVMCCFFYSKHSQTVLYRGKITSLTKLIQMYNSDPSAIRMEIEAKLGNFLRKWFDSAQVTVRLEDTGDDPGIKLRIDAIISTNENINVNATSVGYSLYTRDSTLKTLINLSNGSTLISR